jgi:hypothetical protein
LRLTPPFNLPAPGRRQPLYVVFDFAETCVFVKQSREAFPCGPDHRGGRDRRVQGTPSPEVTGPICLVPEQPITRAPENTHHVHLCRFRVRAPQPILRGFSWQAAGRICLSRPPFTRLRMRSSAGFTGCVPPSVFGGLAAVTECWPCVHQLRLSASP